MSITNTVANSQDRVVESKKETKMRNVQQIQNRNGTVSLSYARSFRRQKLRLYISQNPKATVKEKMEQLTKINKHIDAMFWLTESRTSMMDLLTKHRYVAITGEVGRNGRLVLTLNGVRRSWSLAFFGEAKAIEICIATALTMLNINSDQNRAICGWVLRERILNLINQNKYKYKHLTRYRALPEVRKTLRELHSKMRADKYKFQKKAWITDQEIKVYAKLEYRMLLVPNTLKDAETPYRAVLQRCLVLDSIDVNDDAQKQGWFTSLVNECLQFVYRMKYDALCIDNVINPELIAALDAGSIFTREAEDEHGAVNEFCPRFVRFRDRDTTSALGDVRRAELKR